jgi:tetratricopeptide (TPR) repeat protein
MAGHRLFAELRCYAEFHAGGDPATGALAARAFADARRDRELVTAIAHRVGDTAAGADAWNALGDMLRRAHENEASIAAFRRALDHRAPHDLKGQIHDAVGLYTMYHRYDQFLPALQYASVAYERARELGDPTERAYVLPGIANIVYDMGDLPLATVLADEAEQVIDERSEYLPYLLLLRGNINFARRLYQLAEYQQARAIELARQRPAYASVVRDATFSKAWTQVHRGAFDAAAETLGSLNIDRADAVTSGRYAVIASQVALGRGRPDDAIAIAASVPDAPSGWVAWLDAARGRALAAAGRAAEAEAAFRRSIAQLEIERAELEIDALKPWVLSSQREPFEDLFRLLASQGRALEALAVVQRATARSLLDGLIMQSTTSAPTVADQLDREGARVFGLRAIARSIRASQAVHPPAASELAARLADHRVSTYFRAGSELWLVSLRHGEASATRIGDVADLSSKITAWTTATDRTAAATTLGAMLLPSAELPAPGETLYLAVDDPLRSVAFAALRIDGKYLFERNPTAYIPSASVLATQLDGRHQRAGIVVLGDPEGNLPAARTEAVEVARLLGVRPILGAAATRKTVLTASGSRLLHIAGHAEVRATGAALRLADGPLGAGELIDVGLTARVVVLTSCSSADPLDRDELGPLATAFLASGVEAVVASRWSVKDADAARFARAFYAAGGAQHPISALAAAQADMVAGGISETVWSSFVVIGADASPHAQNP